MLDYILVFGISLLCVLMDRACLIVDVADYAMQVTRMVVSTYQAASGAGAAAMEELEQQTREVFPLLFFSMF